jgi:hypothetical protein
MRPHGSSGRDRMTEGIKKKVPEGTLFQEATAPNWALSCGQQVQKYLHGG